jgi:hypothetical protein
VRSLTATSTHINPYSSTTAIISRYHHIVHIRLRTADSPIYRPF